MKTLADRIRQAFPTACSEATEWAENYTSRQLQKAWDECLRGDWMLWSIGKTITSEPWSEDRKLLLACCLDCADLVAHLRPEKHKESIAKAIETLRKWIRGEATKEEAQEARQRLCDAAYAAAYAAYAAYAAAAAADAYAAANAAYAATDATDAANAATDAADATADTDATDDTDAAAAAAYAADAYAANAAYAAADAARREIYKKCADIVRQHFPKPPKK